MTARNADLPALPRDADGPVFRAPWEAQAFAIVVKLNQAGLIAWPEWTELLAAEIARAQREGDPDLGDTYYRHWLAALERLLIERGLAGEDELRERRIEVAFLQPVAHVHPARRAPVKVS